MNSLSTSKVFLINAGITLLVIAVLVALKYAAGYLIENQIFSGQEKDNNPFLTKEQPISEEDNEGR
tara:strand:+ start:235 stop:432 length:198 start_codon:yes stop_codon:yes gene_type:complete